MQNNVTQTRQRLALASVLALAFISMLCTPLSYADVELPVVPARVMNPVPDEQQGLASDAAAPNGEKPEASPTTLIMRPGVNELIPVALGHLNRIVTPFDSPQVRTTSDAQTQIKGKVVYIATDKETPVSLYITPPGREAPALSLTLVPRRIPPREITLVMDMLSPGNQPWPQTDVVNRKAQVWETAQPYIDSLRDLFRALALNELPQGYDIRLTRKTDRVPKCFQPGLKFDFQSGQVITGHYFTVYAGRVSSFADQPVAAIETACKTRDMVASSFWPRHILLPSEKTELFVVVRNHREEVVESQRPSLLSGGEQ